MPFLQKFRTFCRNGAIREEGRFHLGAPRPLQLQRCEFILVPSGVASRKIELIFKAFGRDVGDKRSGFLDQRMGVMRRDDARQGHRRRAGDMDHKAHGPRIVFSAFAPAGNNEVGDGQYVRYAAYILFEQFCCAACESLSSRAKQTNLCYNGKPHMEERHWEAGWMYTAKEAAERLGMNPHTVRYFVNSVTLNNANPAVSAAAVGANDEVEGVPRVSASCMFARYR